MDWLSMSNIHTEDEEKKIKPMHWPQYMLMYYISFKSYDASGKHVKGHTSLALPALLPL